MGVVAGSGMGVGVGNAVSAGVGVPIAGAMVGVGVEVGVGVAVGLGLVTTGGAPPSRSRKSSKRPCWYAMPPAIRSTTTTRANMGRKPQPPLGGVRLGGPPVGGLPESPPVAAPADLRHLDILSFVQSTHVQ